MGPQVSDEKISLWWSSWCMKQLSQTLHAGGLTCNIIHYDIFLQLYGMSCKTCWIYSTIIFSVSFILKLWKYLETTLLNTPVKDFIVNWVRPPSIYVYIQISPLYQHVNYQLIGHPHQNFHRIFTASSVFELHICKGWSPMLQWSNSLSPKLLKRYLTMMEFCKYPG